MTEELTENRAPQRVIAGNDQTGWLKLLALVFMFCDHAGKMLWPQMPEMRMIGRLAFPLYCWCMVVGFHYTRSVPKYLLRLLVVGLVSQPLYMLALDHHWNEPNILFTLLAALLALWGIRWKRYGSQIWAPIAAMAAATLLHLNYGWQGVLLVVLLYLVHDTRLGITAVMIAFCLFWGTTSYNVRTIFGFKTAPLAQISMIAPWLKLQAMAVFSLPFMLIRFRRKAKMPPWLGYAIYPGHLLVLWGMELLQKAIR